MKNGLVKKGIIFVVIGLFFGVAILPFFGGSEDVHDETENFGPSDSFRIIANNGNVPPNPPSRPNGPTSVTIGIWYTYTTSTTDPNGDQIQYGWDSYGDAFNIYWTDWYYSGRVCTVEIKFESPGTRYVQVKARDWYGAESDFSPPLVVSVSGGGNNPPSTPDKPSGPNSGTIGQSLTFSTSATDPDIDPIRYDWDWGDGDFESSEYMSSGNIDTRSHIWSESGSYSVKVRAVDKNGAESSWSEGLTVAISEDFGSADLDCTGSLVWSSVEPGDLVQGSFLVKNIGDMELGLDWRVASYPSSWGDWTFTPDSGTDLKPGDGPVTVQVFVTAPNVNNTNFGGEVVVVNMDDGGDSEIIPVSLSTPQDKKFNHPFLYILKNLLPHHPDIFPMLRQLLLLL